MYIPLDKMFEVTLSLDTNVYADGDVLANTQEIANVFNTPSESVILNSILMLDKDDQAGALDIVFLRSNTALGTENSALNISDSNAEEIIGIVPILAADYNDYINSQIVVKGPSDTGMGFVWSPDTTSSLWIGAISRDTKTYTASGIMLKIGLIRS